ncbi:MAG TPA: EF-Tu/IF-2/RF-3 family GTPase, partial [Candidatus Limnocylindria bacterium]|nr:EF-Tu/IF-2/RF-3 family GTPase [Candidatus Limnocylindria bacterium]
AAGAIILGFNVRPDAAAKRAADSAGVDVRYYDIIYQLIDDIKAAMVGLLAPETREITDGYAEVRETFRLPTREVVAGLYVLDGKAVRNDRVRVLRSGTVVHDGEVSSLKRFKEDAREVQAGYECGLVVAGFTDVQTGDQIEFYHTEQVARTL